MEDTATGELLGTSAVYSNIGVDAPFYSFVMLTRTQHCFEYNLRSTSKTLHLVNEYTGDSEVGTLILHPDARGRGLGKLLTKCRYLLLAQFRERFGKRVIAELRGWLDEEHSSPFWEHVGKIFFPGLSFKQADYMSATTNNQFIADLMPEYPIYVELLPQSAQEVIGKPHNDGRPAFNMLLQEGFRWENCVDIFDAGPTVHTRVEDIHTVANSQLHSTIISDTNPGGFSALVCNTSLANFRVIQDVIDLDAEDRALLSANAAKHLQISEGDTVRVYRL
jgi:arginine N-succinyltransferase